MSNNPRKLLEPAALIPLQLLATVKSLDSIVKIIHYTFSYYISSSNQLTSTGKGFGNSPWGGNTDSPTRKLLYSLLGWDQDHSKIDRQHQIAFEKCGDALLYLVSTCFQQQLTPQQCAPCFPPQIQPQLAQYIIKTIVEKYPDWKKVAIADLPSSCGKLLNFDWNISLAQQSGETAPVLYTTFEYSTVPKKTTDPGTLEKCTVQLDKAQLFSLLNEMHEIRKRIENQV